MKNQSQTKTKPKFIIDSPSKSTESIRTQSVHSSLRTPQGIIMDEVSLFDGV